MDKVLRDRRLYEFLEKVDKDFASQVKSRGCEHCGAVLHMLDQRCLLQNKGLEQTARISRFFGNS